MEFPLLDRERIGTNKLRGLRFESQTSAVDISTVDVEEFQLVDVIVGHPHVEDAIRIETSDSGRVDNHSIFGVDSLRDVAVVETDAHTQI
jgi:hypothetical protein